MTGRDELESIFAAERSLRLAEQRLMDRNQTELAELLAGAVKEAATLRDEAEVALRLERLSDLCAQVDHERMASLLIEILDCELPSVRLAASEALVDVAYDRYADVARAVERKALHPEGPGAAELPWIIAEIAEPSAAALIARFLTAKDGDVVGSAIEALASLGDPSAIDLVQPLCGDPREVELEEDDGSMCATVGELATEAIEQLKGLLPRS